MLDSATAVLENYITGVSRFTLYSIEMERGKNIEDLYFFCNVDGKSYIVFETDYVDSSPYMAKEAAEIFGVQLEGWLVKKDVVDSLHKMTMPLDTDIHSEPYYSALVSRSEHSYLRHAVLAVKSENENKRFHPAAYGYTTS